MINVGIVGTGIGRHHARGYRSHGKAHIVAVCDIDKVRAEAMAEEYGIPEIYNDYERMLAHAEIDAVSVCSPNALHAPMTIAALEAGKHVFCEKPIATCAEEGRRMVETARRTGKRLMIGFNNRFRADTMHLKECIEQDMLGDIYYAKCGWVRRKGIPGMGGWFTTKKLSGGGPLIDLGVHMLDLTLWLMGNPRPTYVCGSTYAQFGPEMARRDGGTFDVEDLAVGLVKLEGGATIVLEASWQSHVPREVIYTQLVGTRGGAEFDPLRIYTDVNGQPADLTLQPAPRVPAHELEIHHFVDCLLEHREPLATGQHGLDIQLILDALYASSRSGEGVAIEG